MWFDFTVGEKGKKDGEEWEGKRIAEVRMESGVTQSMVRALLLLTGSQGVQFRGFVLKEVF